MVYALYKEQNGFPKAVAAAGISSAKVHVQSLDLTDETAVQEWVASHPDVELCVHLAAMSNPTVCEQEPQKALECNNPQHWFRALFSQNIPIVALSTDQVYDGRNAPYKETDAANAINVYGTTKVALENFFQESISTPFIILRSSIVLGPLAPFGGAHSTFLHFIETRNGQETDFYTDECRSVVSVKDVVDVLVYFCQHGTTSSGIYNMGGRDRVSRYDMAHAVFKYFGHDTRYLVAKKKAALPVSGVASPLDISMDSTKLSQLMGIQFQGLDDIIRDTFPK
jgi:dTDP-4-dehydrorhamnose reductase